MRTPLAPEHMRIVVSFVDICPSTEARSNERLRHTPSSSSAVSADSAASVSTKQSIVAKCGEIMPAPLHCALTRTAPDGSATSTLARFSLASVVWIACWKAASPWAAISSLASRMPLSIASTGRWSLMPPVDASATSAGSTPSAIAAAACVLAASSSPRAPVAAFAQPEFASTARSAFRRQRSRVSRTGAAGVPLEVKRAALTGLCASHSSRPRSGLPLGLIPHATPAARKPLGSPLPAGSSRTCSGHGTHRERKNVCAACAALTEGPRSRGSRTSG